MQWIDKTTGEQAILGFNESYIEKMLKQIARHKKFALQHVARKTLYGLGYSVNSKGYKVFHRTCTCGQFKLTGQAQITYSEDTECAYTSGLMQCGNAKTCPVCASKISERKGEEMREALNEAQEQGLFVSMLTFTAPHSASDLLKDLRTGMSQALQYFWSGNSSKIFRDDFGIFGHIRSFEIRHGSNGWHPHFHILIFSKKPLPNSKTLEKQQHTKSISRQNSPGLIVPGTDEKTLNWLLNRWQNSCLKAGLKKPNHYGMDLQNGEKAGQYITKFGSDDEILTTRAGDKLTWDMADEITKSYVKTGKSRSPFQILDDVAHGETPAIKSQSRRLFLEYVTETKGLTLLKWSRGLRGLFGLGQEQTDEQIVADDDDKNAALVTMLSPLELGWLSKYEQMPALLSNIEAFKGKIDGFANFLYYRFVRVVDDTKITYQDYLNELKERPTRYTEFKQQHGGATAHTKASSNPFVVELTKESHQLILYETKDWFGRYDERKARERELQRPTHLDKVDIQKLGYDFCYDLNRSY